MLLLVVLLKAEIESVRAIKHIMLPIANRKLQEYFLVACNLFKYRSSVDTANATAS